MSTVTLVEREIRYDTAIPSANQPPSSDTTWGPAIVAERSSETDTAGESSAGLSQTLSPTTRNVLFAVPTVVVALFLLILIYALCRRKKAKTRSEIIRFHSKSDADLRRTNNNLTSLPPIHCETRLSQYSSKRSPPMRNSPRFAAPSPVHFPTQDNLQKNSRNLWRSNESRPAPLKVEAYKPHTTIVTANPNKTPSNDVVAVADPITPSKEKTKVPVCTCPSSTCASCPHGETSYLDLSPTCTSPDLDPAYRWSWTNSQAPATPRFQYNNRRRSMLWSSGDGESVRSSLRPPSLYVPSRYVPSLYVPSKARSRLGADPVSLNDRAEVPFTCDSSPPPIDFSRMPSHWTSPDMGPRKPEAAVRGASRQGNRGV